jgi:hypothetical protein
MKTNKLKNSGILGAASMHAGALTGAVVVTGRKIGHCVKSMMTSEQGAAEQNQKRPVQVQMKKIVKKQKKRKAKTAGAKRKTKVPKKTSRSKSLSTSSANAKMSKDKSPKRTKTTGSMS